MLAHLLLVPLGCSDSSDDPTTDSGVDTGSSVQPDIGVDADSGIDADAGEEVVAFWELASPWTTNLRDMAEVPRIYLDHRGWVVVYADDNGERGEELFHARVSQFSSDRILLTNPENWDARQDLHLAVYDDQGVANEFDPADPLVIDLDGNPMEAMANLYFISSTTVEDSEYYFDNCTTEQFENNRTDLPVDCRCNEAQNGGGQAVCWPPGVSYDQGNEWGTGPRMADVNRLSREAGGGFVDTITREYVMTLNWSDETYIQSAGAIWGVNVDTGDRRVISGIIDTPDGYVTVGGGYDSDATVGGVVRNTAPFPYIFDVQVGSDGFWYTYASDGGDNVEIIQVDPGTGDRTLVWHRAIEGAHEEFGQCRRSPDDVDDLTSIQFVDKSFTMDPEGNFYLSFRDSVIGDGIARIDADGMNCTPIMRMHGADGAPDIGGGDSFQSQPIGGLGWVERPDEDPVIVMFTVLGNRLYSVDPDTGDRILVSSVDDEIGTGTPTIGNDWLIWDDETELLWTSGGNSDIFVVVNMTTGDRQNLLQLSSEGPLVPGGYPVEHDVRGPLKPGVWSHGIFYWHPDNRDHIAMAINSMSIGILEIHTSNTYTFSM
ncbi:MAG: hypothetical protein ACJAYU_002221 [Bradymonadia bacterium]|jgi:hypothetical protein